ncbi:MAG: polysaccharide biosynthesis/export family protein [Planctomycetota bacterium]|nr:polysaccharide biosynthesis/export family protein [Planctomycetota bacterium]
MRTKKMVLLGQLFRFLLFILLGFELAFSTGCNSILFKIKGMPAREIPNELIPMTRNHRVPIDFRFLGQEPPQVFRVDSGDVLGIAVDGIFPFNPPTAPPSALPVNFPERDSSMPPSTGFPVVVQQDGTIQLPGIDPFSVRQMTVEEVRRAIADAYRKSGVIREAKIFPIVSLIKARTYNVSVIRQDLGMGSQSIQLDAYRNDVLHALLKTGGLPGEKAKDHVTILRYFQVVPTSPPGSPLHSDLVRRTSWDTPQVIPLTFPIGTNICFQLEGSILNEGDILYIENRETEVFYSAGELPAGQHLLPRDYDIDIFDAMSIAGYSYGSAGGGGNLGGISGVAPTELFIFRKGPDGNQVTIKIDLDKALRDPRERLVVKAGDKLLLRYSTKEEIAKFGMFSFFTFGLQQFLQGN